MTRHFSQVVVCDFEYETSGGEFDLVAGDLPKVLCMVAHVLDENLQHVRTIKQWRGEFRNSPPFDIGNNTLFAAYSAWAELTIFLTLGWEFPTHIFDLHTAYLAASNILLPYEPDQNRTKPRKRLPDACCAYGVEGWEKIDKDAISKDIGEGRWRDHGQDAVYAYCEEDVRASASLLRAQLQGKGYLSPTDATKVLHWSNYSAKVVSRIQARGMPIDVELWNTVQDNKAAVITELLRQFDPSAGSDFPIYTPEGEFSLFRLEQWLASIGVTAWPRLASGRLDTDSDAFRMNYHIYGIERLHALKDSLGVVVRAKLPIGRDGRNRPSLFPFGTATGRNAQSKSLYNAHAGMRSFMVFPEGKVCAYLDWRTQEVGIAAALSNDKALIRDYQGGDVYYALAKLCGLTTDPDFLHWKKYNLETRQRMKSLQLGINYGMAVPSLARGLDRHPMIASIIIEKHKRMYSQFWKWRGQQVDDAMTSRHMETVFGWPLHIKYSPNKRTLFNFPMQGNGAEMLRLAAMRLCDAGIVPNMLVHDAILFELDSEEQLAHTTEIMKSAGRDICNGLEIGVDEERIKGRYIDKRPVAKEMWATIMNALRRIGKAP
jgi:hypothetical protein